MAVTIAPTETTRAPGKPWALDDLAEYLGLSRKTLERAAREGRLKTIRFGARVMVPDAEAKRVSEEGL